MSHKRLQSIKPQTANPEIVFDELTNFELAPNHLHFVIDVFLLVGTSGCYRRNGFVGLRRNGHLSQMEPYQLPVIDCRGRTQAYLCSASVFVESMMHKRTRPFESIERYAQPIFQRRFTVYKFLLICQSDLLMGYRKALSCIEVNTRTP